MKKITNVNDIQVGDVAYFNHSGGRFTVHGIEEETLEVQLPDCFIERQLLHIKKSYFDCGYHYDNTIPEFDRTRPAMFATQDGIPIYYDGSYYQYGGREYNEEDLLLKLEYSALKVFPLRTFIETTDWDNGTAGPRLRNSIQKAGEEQQPHA